MAPGSDRPTLRGRARTVEAMALLATGGAAQRWVPMGRWSWILGVPCAVPPGWTATPVQPLAPRDERASVEREVAYAVRRGCDLLPWEPTCLAQVLAGQVLLRRRRAAAVAVIGLRRGDTGWEAHAWLVGRTRTIAGGSVSRGFTATTLFAVPGAVQPGDVGAPSTRSMA